ncbi:hypothetical protein DFJ77DRAFT_164477 [Powellomyces hirtus]|nr:hypothetical protein DFJ77DRAFT_164477 [Powellomyces hirtus]
MRLVLEYCKAKSQKARMNGRPQIVRNAKTRSPSPIWGTILGHAFSSLLPPTNLLSQPPPCCSTVPASFVLGMYMMELPCYADWCIEHHYDMAKHASRIALGVFYAWITITALVIVFCNRSFRLQLFLSRHITIGSSKRSTSFTQGEALFLLSIVALLAFNFGFYWVQADKLLNSPVYLRRNLHPSRRSAFFTTMLTGKLTDVSLGIIMLLSAKNTGLQTLFGVSFDKSMRAHKWTGYFFVAAVVVHTVVNKSAHKDHALGWYEGNYMVTMGVMSTILLMPAFLLSLPIVRRKLYTLFYFAHFLLFPMMLFAWLHAASDFYYVIPGLGLYAVDVFLRMSGPKVKVIGFKKESTGHIRVDIERPKGWITRPGQWVKIAVPGVARLEWHPYSLAQSPTSSRLTLFFNPISAGSTFESLFAFRLSEAASAASSEQASTYIRLDGPFGSPAFDPATQDVVLCFAAGTGLAPALSVARFATTHADALGQKPKVAVCWSLSQAGGQNVSLIQDAVEEGVAVKVFHTGATVVGLDDDKASPVYTVDVESVGEGNVVTETSTSKSIVKVTDSRLSTNDVEDLLSQYVSNQPSEIRTNVGIFICGPSRWRRSIRHDVLVALEPRNTYLNARVWEEGFEF